MSRVIVEFLSQRNLHIIFIIYLNLLIECFCSYTYASPNTLHTTHTHFLPWSLEIGLGYSSYSHMSANEGNTVLARIGIAKELLHLQQLHAGMEMGVQSGNTGGLNVPQHTLDVLGGLAIESIMKPTMDILVTSKFYPSRYNSSFTQIKAGLMLRQWQFNRGSINNMTKINPEIQIGIGRDINRIVSLALSYQRIVGNAPNFQITSENCYARVAGIPGESGIILGLSIYLDEGSV